MSTPDREDWEMDLIDTWNNTHKQGPLLEDKIDWLIDWLIGTLKI